MSKNLTLNTNQTCILYFSTGNNSSKSFSSKKKKTIAVQKLLFNKTLLEVRKTNLPFLISDGLKTDVSFENKIDSAVNQAFFKGYKNIILVGDDTPRLSTNQLLKAAQSLEKNKLSVGPSSDGGAYLISFTKQQFKNGLLKGLAWQTNQFYKSLLLNINHQKLPFSKLSEFADLDSESDIQQFLQTHSFFKFSKLLKSIFEFKKTIVSSFPLIESGYILSLNARGPPIAA